MSKTSEFFLHNPADTSQSYVRWAEKLASDPGIDFGCVLDKHVVPLHPGDMLAVVARPGHGKSSFMAYMARREALRIFGRDKVGEEASIYVSWEQPVEEIEAFFQSGKDYSSSDLAWGRADLDVVRAKAVKRAGTPIWTIGVSLEDANVKKPHMTVPLVYDSIETMQSEYGVRPTLICLDYIQKIPVGRGGDRHTQVTEATFAAKELAMQVGAPVIVGVQASRTVDAYQYPIPTMSDAQWSSAVEQTADKQFGIWRPAKSFDPVEKPYIPLGGTDYRNSEDLFVVKLLKQRMEKGYGVWPVHFKPHTLELTDYRVG